MQQHIHVVIMYTTAGQFRQFTFLHLHYMEVVDVCCINSIECKSLWIDMYNLQSETDDLFKELNVSILQLLTIM